MLTVDSYRSDENGAFPSSESACRRRRSRPLKSAPPLPVRARHPTVFAWSFYHRGYMTGTRVRFIIGRGTGIVKETRFSGVRRPQYSRGRTLNQPDPPHQLPEPWLLAQAVKPLIHFEP